MNHAVGGAARPVSSSGTNTDASLRLRRRSLPACTGNDAAEEAAQRGAELKALVQDAICQLKERSKKSACSSGGGTPVERRRGAGVPRRAGASAARCRTRDGRRTSSIRSAEN